MTLTLLVLLLMAAVLAIPVLLRSVAGLRRRGLTAARTRRGELLELPDPGRERRAEQRARELLRSCVDEEEWEMYRDLGFIRVHGGQARRPPERARRAGDGARRPDEPASAYAYLIYPHKPIVAFVPETGQLLSEYCVEFPDLTSAVAGSRLPDSDDVLAKWMALTGDERRLIAEANLHLPGRQVDPARVRRDIWRLAEWERRRGRGELASRTRGSS